MIDQLIRWILSWFRIRNRRRAKRIAILREDREIGEWLTTMFHTDPADPT